VTSDDDDDLDELSPADFEPEPWERQLIDGKLETTRAYEAFETYRDLGPARSLRKTAIKLGKSRIVIERWARKYGWTSRVLAWDEMLEAERRGEAVAETRKMARRQAQQAMAAAAALMQPLAALLKPRRIELGGGEIYEVNRMTELEAEETGRLMQIAAMASRAMAVAFTTERLARGEPTEIQGVTTQATIAALSSDDTEAAPLDMDLKRMRELAAALEDAGIRPDGANGAIRGVIIDPPS
jgi:hypothetical protein